MSNEKREQQMMDSAKSAELNSRTIDLSKKQVFMSAYIQGWRAADSHPHWIPVEERLPEEKGKYMFLLSNGDMYYETYYPKLKLVSNVTHWMEIVPPRKEDKK